MKQTCPIWDVRAERQYDSHDRMDIVDSPRAGGRYLIDSFAQMRLAAFSPAQKAALSDYIFERNAVGELPKIWKDNIDKLSALPVRSLQQRTERLFVEIANACRHLADKVVVSAEPNRFMAAASAVNEEEVTYLLQALEADGFISASYDFLGAEVSISPRGYALLSDLQHKTRPSNTGFVAMWFAPEMDEIYERGFKVGIEQAGFEPVIIRKKEYAGKVVDEIVAEIRRSRFVVADFTCNPPKEARGGVYFEAGFAMGIGLPVIWTCRADTISHVHFDTNHYNHIVWQNADELATALDRRIRAVVGNP